MSEIKLLPCPFCGESELIHRSQMHFTDSTEENMIHEDGTKKWTYIECGRCGCSTKAYCYEYQSTNKWNTRKPMDKIVEKLEEKIFKAELHDFGWEGQTVNNLLCFGDVAEIINQVAEEHNNGWILCSEQMPKEHESIFAKHKGTDNWCDGMFEKYSDDVNVTIEFKDEERMTMTLQTIDGKWPCDLSKFKKSYRVIAWQPLPEPYQPSVARSGQGQLKVAAEQNATGWKKSVMRTFTNTEESNYG